MRIGKLWRTVDRALSGLVGQGWQLCCSTTPHEPGDGGLGLIIELEVFQKGLARVVTLLILIVFFGPKMAKAVAFGKSRSELHVGEKVPGALF